MYRIVRMAGGSWFPASKKKFRTYKGACGYSKRITRSYGQIYIIEQHRITKHKRVHKKREWKWLHDPKGINMKIPK